MIFSAVIESVSAADLIYKELPSFDLRWDEYKGRQGLALVSGTTTSEGREVAALECPVEEEKGVVCRYFISRGLVVRASNEDRHMTLTLRDESI